MSAAGTNPMPRKRKRLISKLCAGLLILLTGVIAVRCVVEEVDELNGRR